MERAIEFDPAQPTTFPLPKQTDEQLLAAVAQQEITAFEILYDRYAQVAYSLILRIVRNRTLAEEQLQETFWQIWCTAKTYRRSGPVAAWLLRIARNRALDTLRRQKVRPCIQTDDFSLSVDNIVTEPTPFQSHLDRYGVQQALAALPKEQLQCLELSYFDGFTHREIAEQLDIAIGTVKSHVRLALEKLERALRSQGYY